MGPPFCKLNQHYYFLSEHSFLTLPDPFRLLTLESSQHRVDVSSARSSLDISQLIQLSQDLAGITIA